MNHGRGRFRPKNSQIADLLGNTMDDIGLTKSQIDRIAGDADAIYPPIELPYPMSLSEKDIYMIQKRREFSLKMENLYYINDKFKNQNDLKNVQIHITVPDNETNLFIPKELICSSISSLPIETSDINKIIQPKAIFEKTLKTLEAQEQKNDHPISNTSITNVEDDDDEEQEEDLGDDGNDYSVDHYESDQYSDDDVGEEYF